MRRKALVEAIMSVAESLALRHTSLDHGRPPAERARWLMAVAEGWIRLGRKDRARGLLDKAQKAVAQLKNWVGWVTLKERLCQAFLDAGAPDLALVVAFLIPKKYGNRGNCIRSVARVFAMQGEAVAANALVPLGACREVVRSFQAVGLARAGRWTKALARIKECRLMNTHPSLLFEIAFVAAEAGERDRAVALVGRALDEGGTVRWSYIEAARSTAVRCHRLGFHGPAERLFEALWQWARQAPTRPRRHSEYPSACAQRIDLAKALLDIGRRSKAATLLREALPIFRRWNKCRRLVRGSLVLTLARCGLTDELQSLIHEGPSSEFGALASLILARAHAAKGNRRKALELFDSVADEVRERRCFIALAHVHMALGELNRSLVVVAKAGGSIKTIRGLIAVATALAEGTAVPSVEKERAARGFISRLLARRR